MKYLTEVGFPFIDLTCILDNTPIELSFFQYRMSQEMKQPMHEITIPRLALEYLFADKKHLVHTPQQHGDLAKTDAVCVQMLQKVPKLNISANRYIGSNAIAPPLTQTDYLLRFDRKKCEMHLHEHNIDDSHVESDKLFEGGRKVTIDQLNIGKGSLPSKNLSNPYEVLQKSKLVTTKKTVHQLSFYDHCENFQEIVGLFPSISKLSIESVDMKKMSHVSSTFQVLQRHTNIKHFECALASGFKITAKGLNGFDRILDTFFCSKSNLPTDIKDLHVLQKHLQEKPISHIYTLHRGIYSESQVLSHDEFLVALEEHINEQIVKACGTPDTAVTQSHHSGQLQGAHHSGQSPSHGM